MLPSIRGDLGNMDFLRACLRRLIVLDIDSCFKSDAKSVDISKKVCVEVARLMAFLDSPQARLAYVNGFSFRSSRITRLTTVGESGFVLSCASRRRQGGLLLKLQMEA